jgi:hypothetical protein
MLHLLWVSIIFKVADIDIKEALEAYVPQGTMN